MTRDDFLAALSAIRWSQRGLADALGCDDRLVRRWASGEAAIPPPVAVWLRTRQADAERHPPPRDWKTR